MAYNLEIKVNSQDIGSTVKMLTANIMQLNEMRMMFMNANNSMKVQGIGETSQALGEVLEILEKKLDKMIRDLCQESSDLNSEKESMFNQDMYIAESYAQG